MFTKPALTIEQQVNLLIKRGMEISDRNFAQQYLSHVNCYRLRAYWLPFEVQATTVEMHQFRVGSTFKNVIALYEWLYEVLSG